MVQKKKILFFHTGDSNSSKVEKLLKERSIVKENFSFTTVFSNDAVEPILLVDFTEFKGDQILDFLN